MAAVASERREVRMISLLPKSDPLPCVYCGEVSIDWAFVPKHVECPEHECTAHVIPIRQPVCLKHHPSPQEIKEDLRYRQEEERRERKVEAKRFLLNAVFDEEFSKWTAGQVIQEAKNRWAAEVVDDARKELQAGNFELY